MRPANRKCFYRPFQETSFQVFLNAFLCMISWVLMSHREGHFSTLIKSVTEEQYLIISIHWNCYASQWISSTLPRQYSGLIWLVTRSFVLETTMFGTAPLERNTWKAFIWMVTLRTTLILLEPPYQPYHDLLTDTENHRIRILSSGVYLNSVRKLCRIHSR